MFSDKNLVVTEVIKKLHPNRKEEINKIWEIYKDYAPSKFQTNFLKCNSIHDYQSKLWEMVLTVKLIQNGYKIIKQEGDKHPDIKLEYDSQIVWVECYLPSDKLDKEEREKKVREINIEETQLRITSGLVEKKKQMIRFIKNEICKSSEPYFFAFNLKNLPIIKSDLYACLYETEHTWSYCPHNKSVSSESRKKEEIKKISGKGVSVNFFKQSDTQNIRGLIFCETLNFNIDNDIRFLENTNSEYFTDFKLKRFMSE